MKRLTKSQLILEQGSDRVLGITSSRQHNFDFQLNGYYEDYKIGITYCKKQNTDSLSYFAKLNIQLIEIYFTDFNYDNHNKIIRKASFDEKILRQKLTSLS